MLHFQEEHQGAQQEVLMRVIQKHQRPLERQVIESLNIEIASRKPEECLNLKSEWCGSKMPGLVVSTPKGVRKTKDKEPALSGEKTVDSGAVEMSLKRNDNPKRIRTESDMASVTTSGSGLMTSVTGGGSGM